MENSFKSHCGESPLVIFFYFENYIDKVGVLKTVRNEGINVFLKTLISQTLIWSENIPQSNL